jgi:hypothetical protein
MSKWTKDLKKYEKYMTDFHKKKKVQKEKHYSSFWWDDDWSTGNSRFGGWNDDVKATGSSDIVKMIKLTSYQRAIANFVKIVTKKDIPVVFGGSNSMTNGKQVVIASDISDKNFDVAVGLSLHEASHIKLTDFEAIQKYYENSSVRYNGFDDFKTLVNIIEDRRIDNYIFKTSPGYRAYYHKMYDHYFHSDNISKALVSKSFRDATNISHYVFRIANMTNPLSVRTALPGLSDIFNMIDVANIGRLQSTTEVCVLAHEVLNEIYKQVNIAQQQQAQQPTKTQPQPGNGDQDDTVSDNTQPSNKMDDADTVNSEMGHMDLDMSGLEGEESSEQSDIDNNTAGNANGNESGSDVAEQTLSELSPNEQLQVQKAWDKQKEFLSGDVKKKSATKKTQEELEKVSKMDLDVQMVGDKNKGYQCIIYDLVNKMHLRNLVVLNESYLAAKTDEERNALLQQIQHAANITLTKGVSKWTVTNAIDLPYFMQGTYMAEVLKGFELGALLGRKLQVRNEERTLVHNRLISGRIDSKRLSHAGYGIETVFKQIHTDRYKQACLHISIDMSGSMGGKKWIETIQMTAAIAKAATYVQNLRVQVSARATTGSGRRELPMLVLAYDSKVNDLKHFMDIMKHLRPVSCTPEGLCFDALIRKNILMPSTSECTSYFLNISDGAPGMGGWGGHEAVEYTRKQVQRMKNDLGVNVLSFYVTDSRYDNGQPNEWFTKMYGKDSKVVQADNVTQIARALNDKFLAEGKYTS